MAEEKNDGGESLLIFMKWSVSMVMEGRKNYFLMLVRFSSEHKERG